MICAVHPAASLHARISGEVAPLSFLYIVINDNCFYVPTAEPFADSNACWSNQQAVVKTSYLRQL